MGFFSWKTMENKKSISNIHSGRGAFPVVLLVPKEFGGKDIIEEAYDGYGVFGGKDAYELLANWNKPFSCVGNTETDRCIGINIGCYEQDIEKLKYPLRFVSLSHYESTGCKYEDFTGFSKNCPDQGFFY